MNEPSVWQEILSDPTTPFDRVTLGQVVRDQRRPSRRWLYPWLRHVSRAAVVLIRLVKTLLPFRFSAHSTMDRLCIWFLRRFVSVDAGALLLRHFVVETNLLIFPAPGISNCGGPGAWSANLTFSLNLYVGSYVQIVVHHATSTIDHLIVDDLRIDVTRSPSTYCSTSPNSVGPGSLISYTGSTSVAPAPTSG